MTVKKRNQLKGETFEEMVLNARAMTEVPIKRVLITLCVDCSYSMSMPADKGDTAVRESRYDLVMKGLNDFCEDMQKDGVARENVDLCVVSFGGTEAKLEVQFTPMGKLELPLRLETRPNGGTPIGDAVRLALENLGEAKALRDSMGIIYDIPWLLILSDGSSSDTRQEEIMQARQLLREQWEKGLLRVQCISVGKQEAMQRTVLNALAPDGRVNWLMDMDYREFFSWLSQNVKMMSRSVSRMLTQLTLESWDSSPEVQQTRQDRT